jgi:hypothetical protein
MEVFYNYIDILISFVKGRLKKARGPEGAIPRFLVSSFASGFSRRPMNSAGFLWPSESGRLKNASLQVKWYNFFS